MVGRPRDPRIADLKTHPRTAVSLTVAADYLGLDPRTVRARVETGELEATRDGRVYRIGLAALAACRGRAALRRAGWRMRR